LNAVLLEWMEQLQNCVQVECEYVGWAKRTLYSESLVIHEIRLCYTWRGIPYTYVYIDIHVDIELYTHAWYNFVITSFNHSWQALVLKMSASVCPISFPPFFSWIHLLCRVLLCRLVSCLMLCRLVLPFLSWLVLFCFVLSCLVSSYHVILYHNRFRQIIRYHRLAFLLSSRTQMHSWNLIRFHPDASDLGWFDVVPFGLVWFALVWYTMAWTGVVWYEIIWNGMAWYDLVWWDWGEMDDGIDFLIVKEERILDILNIR
jgi:hypothetical protein